jgi:hypothetical protein
MMTAPSLISYLVWASTRFILGAEARLKYNTGSGFAQLQYEKRSAPQVWLSDYIIVVIPADSQRF